MICARPAITDLVIMGYRNDWVNKPPQRHQIKSVSLRVTSVAVPICNAFILSVVLMAMVPILLHNTWFQLSISAKLQVFI